MLSINQISAQIFLGSAPKDISDIRVLSENHQITSVLNLQTDSDLRVRNTDIVLLEKKYQQFKMNFHRFPVNDVDADDMARKIISPIQHLINEVKVNKIVYVHCNAGICRASSTVLGYFYLYEGMDLKEGLDYIRSKRPIANPYVSAVEEAIKKFEQSSLT